MDAMDRETAWPLRRAILYVPMPSSVPKRDRWGSARGAGRVNDPSRPLAKTNYAFRTASIMIAARIFMASAGSKTDGVSVRQDAEAQARASA